MLIDIDRPSFEVPLYLTAIVDGNKMKIPLHLIPTSEIEPMLEEFCTKVREYMEKFAKISDVVERAFRLTKDDIKAGVTPRVALMGNITGLCREDAALVIKLVEDWNNSPIL